jgi:hypothetical protein
MAELQLFNDASSHINYLNIVKDNQVVKLKLDEIFDTTLYDEFYAVSYVTSPRFFSRVIKKFQKVKFVLGIPDGELLQDFANRLHHFLDVKERIQFWNELEDETKTKITTNHFEIRYPILSSTESITVHSKIYLLKNSQEPSYNRVIMGSANLTENAFLKNGQFEEIIIFDNSPLFQIYFERFNAIFDRTVDFIPKDFKKKAKEQPQIIHTTDEQTLKNVLLDITDSVEKTLVISEADMKNIKEMGLEYEYKMEQVDRTNEVLQLVLQKKNNYFKFEPKAKLTKKAMAIQTAICKTNKNSESADNRNYLKYVESEDFLYVSSNNQADLQKFSALLSKENLVQALNLLNKFVDAYGIFTEYPELRNQSKVFEIILYAFMSPYIWKIRKDYSLSQGRMSSNRDIPPFLIIGGKAGSGKTTILEFISLLMGWNTFDKYWHYSKLDKTGIIYDYFHSENLYPIIVDEVPVNFFQSKDQKKGEALIKYITNQLSTQHPVFIATTNLSDFSISNQVLTRIYYLEIDKPFDKSKRSISIPYLNDIFANTTTDLFRDFTYKMSQLIYDKESFYNVDDVLSVAREIFVEYYKEADLELPKWFPNTIFNDYEERGKRIWKSIFNAHQEFFKINEASNSIFIDINKFAPTEKQRNTLVQFLNSSTTQEDSAILVVRKEPFYKFIGYEENNPVEKDEEQKAESKLVVEQEINQVLIEAEKKATELESHQITQPEYAPKTLMQRFKALFVR